jgi:hypothetical protein
MNMARPPRPRSEAQLVREAAAIVRGETGATSARALSREVAIRVTAELMKEIEGDPVDLALAAIERDLIGSPFHRLASCPEIDTASLYVELRVDRLRARSGRFLSLGGQAAERALIISALTATLAGRYDRHLRRSHKGAH